MKVWCVEDDRCIREIESYTLEQTGFDVMSFEDGTTFLAALENDLPDIVILDIMLPGMDGVEILRKMRRSGRLSDIPVIMATAKGEEYDKIEALDLGADDYLVKPFGMMEMVSRVKAVLRRCGKVGQSRILMMGPVSVNTESHVVKVEGKKVVLTLKEYELLRTFLENPGRCFTREQLLSRVWGLDAYYETRTVDMHMKTLRQKLGNADGLVKTVRGVGYMMEEDR